MSTWQIVCKPDGHYDERAADDNEGTDTNRGAMIVVLTNGTVEQEVSRVGFVRRNTKNPDTAFQDQLRSEVETGRASVKMLNDMMGGGEVV